MKVLVVVHVDGDPLIINFVKVTHGCWHRSSKNFTLACAQVLIIAAGCDNGARLLRLPLQATNEGIIRVDMRQRFVARDLTNCVAALHLAGVEEIRAITASLSYRYCLRTRGRHFLMVHI